jgi:hypothetical protein
MLFLVVPSTANSISAAIITTKKHITFINRINRNNTHTVVAFMLTYCRWVWFWVSSLEASETFWYNRVKDFVTVDLVSLWTIVPISITRDTSLTIQNMVPGLAGQ